jgi:hypothetical protein
MSDNLIKISNEILDELLKFKSMNPDFTFSLRQRDSVQSEEKRLEKGQWFQGSNYIYVPLFQKGDSARKIKTIGFVITFSKKQAIESNYIEISFKDGAFNPNEIKFHKELAEKIKITLDKDNHGRKLYANPNAYIDNLKDYITNFRKLALEALERRNIKSGYIISEASFQKSLRKINSIKLNLNQHNSQAKSHINLISNKMKTQPLNQILFGPPGTGKTYNTINRALEIIGESIEGKTRQEIKSLFDSKIKDGQIVFTTFHQSMSYEDFIEGIKPLKPLTDDKFVKYDIQPGIFYTISEKAKSNFQNSKLENKRKLSFEEAFEQFKEEWEKNTAMKFPLKTEGYDFTIIGFTNTSIQFKKASGGTSHTLSIGTLKELYYGKEFDFKQGVGIYYPSVLKKVQSYKKEESEEVLLKNYVIIIDEINRGNVSQIFGELITLIEEDKRLGNYEALEATLPYSKESFGVPPNLYIIGTMNTADRSVEALDAALRRRFSFIEMPPRPELVSPQRKIWELWWNYPELDWDEEPFATKEKELFHLLGIDGDFDPLEEIWNKMEKEGRNEKQVSHFDTIPIKGINPESLLITINKRIEKLLDKDHQIGHSYFMSVNSMTDLKLAFTNKIIPLLQEYFFGDYGKIGLVLGEGFIRIKESDDKSDDFAEFNTENNTDFERPVYEIINYMGSYSKHIVKFNGKDVEMNFEKAIKLLMKFPIE